MKLLNELLAVKENKITVFLKYDKPRIETHASIDEFFEHMGVVDISKNGECFFHYIEMAEYLSGKNYNNENSVRICLVFFDAFKIKDIKKFFSSYKILFQRVVNELNETTSDKYSNYSNGAVNILKELLSYPKQKEELEGAIEFLIDGNLGRFKNSDYFVIQCDDATDRQLIKSVTRQDDTSLLVVVEYDDFTKNLATNEIYVKELGKYYHFVSYDKDKKLKYNFSLE